MAKADDEKQVNGELVNAEVAMQEAAKKPGAPAPAPTADTVGEYTFMFIGEREGRFTALPGRIFYGGVPVVLTETEAQSALTIMALQPICDAAKTLAAVPKQ